MATIVLVEDNLAILSVFKNTLESCGHVVISTMSCNEAEAVLIGRKQRIDLVLTDYHLPDGKGLSNIECAKMQAVEWRNF